MCTLEPYQRWHNGRRLDGLTSPRESLAGLTYRVHQPTTCGRELPRIKRRNILAMPVFPPVLRFRSLRLRYAKSLSSGTVSGARYGLEIVESREGWLMEINEPRTGASQTYRSDS